MIDIDDIIEEELLSHIEQGMESGAYAEADTNIVRVSYIGPSNVPPEPRFRELRCALPPSPPEEGRPDLLAFRIAIPCVALTLLVFFGLFVRGAKRKRLEQLQGPRPGLVIIILRGDPVDYGQLPSPSNCGRAELPQLDISDADNTVGRFPPDHPVNCRRLPSPPGVGEARDLLAADDAVGVFPQDNPVSNGRLLSPSSNGGAELPRRNLSVKDNVVGGLPLDNPVNYGRPVSPSGSGGAEFLQRNLLSTDDIVECFLQDNPVDYGRLLGK